MAPPAPSTDWPAALTTADGLRLAGRCWRPEDPARAAVLLVHGYAEHSGRYEHVGGHLAAHGFATFAVDLRGHGRSEGRRAFVADFADYLDDLALVLGAVRAAHEGPLFLFAHSMGGAVAALYALERPLDVAGLLLSSPALRVNAETPPLLRKLAPLIGRLLPRLPTVSLDTSQLSRDPAVVRRYETDPLVYNGRLLARTAAELLRASARIDRHMDRLALPLLLLHGTADAITDPAGSQALYRRAASTDKTLILYPGFYHETFNEPEGPQVLTDLTHWLDEHVER